MTCTIWDVYRDKFAIETWIHDPTIQLKSSYEKEYLLTGFLIHSVDRTTATPHTGTLSDKPRTVPNQL